MRPGTNLQTVGVPRKPSVAYYGGAFCFTTNAVFYLNMGRKTRRKLAAVQERCRLEEAYSSSNRMVSAASQAFPPLKEKHIERSKREHPFLDPCQF